MTPTPKRRWPRFTLRTLFVVVTAFGIWLGWNFNILRQREKMLDRVNATRNDGSPVGIMMEAEFESRLPPAYRGMPSTRRLPWALKLLGAEPTAIITVSEDDFSEAEIKQIGRLFPEALVSPWSPPHWNERSVVK
jgi:hypothetical protein